MTQEQSFLTVSELAVLKKVNVSTARRWIDKGMIPARKIGPIWVIAKADAIEFTPRSSGRPDCEIDFEKIEAKAEELEIPVSCFRGGQFGGGIHLLNCWTSTNGVPESQIEHTISVECNPQKNTCVYKHINTMKATTFEAESVWRDNFRNPTEFFLEFLDAFKAEEGSVLNSVSMALGLSPEPKD